MGLSKDFYVLMFFYQKEGVIASFKEWTGWIVSDGHLRIRCF